MLPVRDRLYRDLQHPHAPEPVGERAGKPPTQGRDQQGHRADQVGLPARKPPQRDHPLLAVVERAGHVQNPKVEWAFAAVAREPFVDPGPWSINIPGAGYAQTFECAMTAPAGRPPKKN